LYANKICLVQSFVASIRKFESVTDVDFKLYLYDIKSKWWKIVGSGKWQVYCGTSFQCVIIFCSTMLHSSNDNADNKVLIAKCMKSYLKHVFCTSMCSMCSCSHIFDKVKPQYTCHFPLPTNGNIHF
jgi:hypothetical protein